MTSSHRYAAMLIVLIGCGGEEFQPASGAQSASDASAAGGQAGSAGSSGTAGSHDASAAGAAGSGDAGEAGSAGSGNAGEAGSAGSGNAGEAGAAGSGDAGVAGSAGSEDAGVEDALVADSGEAGAAGAGGFDGGVVDGGVCPEQGVVLNAADPSQEWGLSGNAFLTSGPSGRAVQLTSDEPYQSGILFYQTPLTLPEPVKITFRFGIARATSTGPVGEGLAFAWLDTLPMPSWGGSAWNLSGSGLVLAIDPRDPLKPPRLVLAKLSSGAEEILWEESIQLEMTGAAQGVELLINADRTARVRFNNVELEPTAPLPSFAFEHGYIGFAASTGPVATQRAMLYSFALDCRPQTTAKYLAPDRPLDLGIPAGHRTEFNPLGRRLSAPLHGSR